MFRSYWIRHYNIPKRHRFISVLNARNGTEVLSLYMDIHVHLIHKGEFKFQCQRCQRKFLNKHHYETHRKLHLNKLKYFQIHYVFRICVNNSCKTVSNICSCGAFIGIMKCLIVNMRSLVTMFILCQHRYFPFPMNKIY